MPRDGRDIVEYVRGILERDGLSAAALAERMSPTEEGWRWRPEALTERDLEIVQKVERTQPLDEYEQRQLEAIILPNGLRPSFDVQGDTFNDLPGPWTELNLRKAALAVMIRGIGRLNLVGNPGRPIGGTAFVVASDLVMTNRHVAEFFVDGLGGAAALQFKSGMSANVDVKEEVGSLQSVKLTVTAPVLILDACDAALVRVAGLPAGVSPLPLAGALPTAVEARLSAVIGYPGFDPRADLAQQLMLLRSLFDKKRLMPGRLMGRKDTESFGRTVSALAHDCTTLGGNSGSALIDIATGTVVGLHFKGDAGIANYSVPTSELAADARVRSAGVDFL